MDTSQKSGNRRSVFPVPMTICLFVFFLAQVGHGVRASDPTWWRTCGRSLRPLHSFVLRSRLSRSNRRRFARFNGRPTAGSCAGADTLQGWFQGLMPDWFSMRARGGILLAKSTRKGQGVGSIFFVKAYFLFFSYFGGGSRKGEEELSATHTVGSNAEVCAKISFFHTVGFNAEVCAKVSFIHHVVSFREINPAVTLRKLNEDLSCCGNLSFT